MGFARRMRRAQSFINSLADAAQDDPVFMAAAEFDEGAANLGAREAQVCRKDSSPLAWVRRVSMSIWEYDQVQLECPLCKAKYVQPVEKG